MNRRRFLHRLAVPAAAIPGLPLVARAAESDPAAERAPGAEVISLEDFETGPDTLLVASADAHPRVREVAHYQCDGTDDDQTIAAAVAALASHGGTVRLSEGLFHCTGAVRLTTRIALVGQGRSTILRAHGTWPAFDGTTVGGLIEPAAADTQKNHVAWLALDGNRYQGAEVKGIYYNITSNAGFDEGPDAGHWFSDLYVFRTRHSAVHLAGGRMRATKLSGVRVYNPGAEGAEPVAHGFHIDCPDGFYTQCECGSASGAGFYIEGANNRFTNCKAWYSDLSGFIVRTWRNQFSACESQDNEQHGFHINSGPNSFVGCHADSNSWNSAAPAQLYDGFHIPAGKRIQLVGCAAYDKNEGNRGNQQRYGFYLGAGSEHCQILGTTRDNKVAAVGGAGAGHETHMLMITG